LIIRRLTSSRSLASMASLSCPASCNDSTCALSFVQLVNPVVLPGDMQPRPRVRLGLAGFEQVLGLFLEMAEVGVLGKLARGFFGMRGHGSLLSVGARCPHDGPKEGSCSYAASRWASTLSADRVRPVRGGGWYRVEYGRQAGGVPEDISGLSGPTPGQGPSTP